MAKMKQDGVYEEELRALAAQINFPINTDDDLIRLFQEAKKLGFWPKLDIPRPDAKTGFFVPITGELRPLSFGKRARGNKLYYLDENVTTKGRRQKDKSDKQNLVLELQRLTKLANALENFKLNDEIDDFLNKI